MVQVRNFIHLFEFKGFSTWGERNTIFLCWLLLHRQLSTQPTHGARSAQSRLASTSSECQPSSSEAGTKLTAFSQIPAHASSAWRHPNTLVSIPIWDFYFDISEWHILSVCAWTPALMLHLTNPCTKRKVLILTKPKGKIYKTKSLRHYITCVFESRLCIVWFVNVLLWLMMIMDIQHHYQSGEDIYWKIPNQNWMFLFFFVYLAQGHWNVRNKKWLYISILIK